MTERVPGWLERILLPRLSEIAGEIKAVNVKIDAVDEKLSTKIDEVDKRLSAKIDDVDKRLGENDRRLAEKIDEVDKRLGSKIDDLDKRLDIAQRVAVLEARMSELRPKA